MRPTRDIVLFVAAIALVANLTMWFLTSKLIEPQSKLIVRQSDVISDQGQQLKESDSIRDAQSGLIKVQRDRIVQLERAVAVKKGEETKPNTDEMYFLVDSVIDGSFLRWKLHRQFMKLIEERAKKEEK